MTDQQPSVKFRPEMILKSMYKTGTVHPTDFSNDLDYPQQLRWTKKGPNALGRLDNHKINFQHRQLHPSVIGKIDLLDSSKDVGQTGMISPWSDVSTIYDINKADLSKYKNIRYDLFDFIRHEFPEPDLVFHVNSEKEYNDVLDRLLMSTYMKLNYGPVNPSERSNE